MSPRQVYPDCQCLDFDATKAHRWVPPESREEGKEFYENLVQGDFPDWLEYDQDDNEDFFDALLETEPRALVEMKLTECDRVCAPEDLPFDCLRMLLNRYKYPATHIGMKSVPFWLKIFARFSRTYRFYAIHLGPEAFETFRREMLDPKTMWVLPYWCLQEKRRAMIVVVRNTKHVPEDWKRLNSPKKLLDAIGSVCTDGEHIAEPMIPHARWWMSLLIPDQQHPFQLTEDGITDCNLQIGTKGQRIDLDHPAWRTNMVDKILQKTDRYVFFDDRCFFVMKPGQVDKKLPFDDDSGDDSDDCDSEGHQ